MKDINQAVRCQELQRFSQNASLLLLKDGRLQAFLSSLNCTTSVWGPDELRGRCPVCRASVCLIGLRGRVHTVYWRCFDQQCPSNTGEAKYHRNLLGLVRALVEDHKLGRAIEVVAAFLGYAGRSFDITNGKFARPKEVTGHPQEKERKSTRAAARTV